MPRISPPANASSAQALDGKPRTKLTDDEALDLIQYRASRYRDPVHAQLEREWMRAVTWYAGVQDGWNGEVGEDFDTWRSPEGKYIANYIFRMVAQQVSRLTSSRGRYEILPKTSDYRDRTGSKVAQAMHDHYAEQYDDAILTEMAYWAVLCGTGFLYCGWDSNKGQPETVFTNPFNEQTIREDSLTDDTRVLFEEMGWAEEMRSGDIDQCALSPMQVLVPHGIPNLQDLPWVMIERPRSLDWVWDHFPKQAKEVRPDMLGDSRFGSYWYRLSSAIGSRTFPSLGAFLMNDDVVIVRELWIPPSGRLKQGARVVATERTLLENEPHPAFIDKKFEFRFPLACARYTLAPGRLYGLSPVTQIIDPQNESNIAATQIIMQRDRLARPTWIAPVGVKVSQRRPVGIGEIVEYEGFGGQRPELVPPPPLSQAHMETRMRSLEDMRLILAQSEVSQAQVPQGVRSGVAIRHLRDQDLQSLAITVGEMERAMQDHSRNRLKLIANYMKMPKAVRIYGEALQGDVGYFAGADMRGNTMIRVVPGSMAPKSKAESMQHILELVQLGVLMPAQSPEDKSLVMETLEVGDPTKILHKLNLDRRRAQMDIDLFMNPRVDERGEPLGWPDADEDDNHEVMLDEMELFQKTDVYQTWPDDRKMAWKAKMAKHKQYLVLMAEAQAALQQNLQGGAGTPQGSPPKQLGQPSPPARTPMQQ